MSQRSRRLDPERSEARFEDFKKPLGPQQAVAEANRCLYCFDAPCVQACPTDIDIPEFIRKIATGNVKGSARTILEANVLGMSCARVCPVEVLCAGDCVYTKAGAPAIEIGKLQRYATDIAYDAGWEFFEPGPDSGMSVGLVGGGPASLAAAHALRRQGHACTIYEARDVLGGINTWAVAPYKLRADRALSEVDWVLGIGGIEVQTALRVGQDLSWQELEQRHDALFIGMGLGADQWLGLPGAELPGVQGAVRFIEAMKLGQVQLDGVRQAVVVGGGNTAVDAVRELLGLGVETVTMVYRRDQGAMPGYAHEWAAAQTEGALALWQSQPLAFEGEGKLERLRVTPVDEDCQPLPGGEQTVEAQLALMAIGQDKQGELLAALPGIVIEGGKVCVDENGATGRAGVYAGGDCVNGGKEVVNAVAEGKAAAEAMDRYLSALPGKEPSDA